MRSLLALILAFCTLTAHAQSNWTNEDTAWQAVLLSELYMDYRQTRLIAVDPWHHEINLVLGPRPSAAYIRNYFLMTAVGTTALAYVLPPEYRRLMQWYGIGVEFGFVTHNWSLGFKVPF